MGQNKTIVTNRKARRDFYIDKTYEAGLQLKGNEVKSLRAGKADLKGSFAVFDRGELFLQGMHINPYEYSQEDYNPLRTRKLLLHKAEMRYLEQKIAQRGYALIPLKVYFHRGYAKIELGLGRGKKQHDKRVTLKEKQAKREMDRALSHKGKHK